MVHTHAYVNQALRAPTVIRVSYERDTYITLIDLHVTLKIATRNNERKIMSM